MTDLRFRFHSSSRSGAYVAYFTYRTILAAMTVLFVALHFSPTLDRCVCLVLDQGLYASLDENLDHF